MMFDKKKLNFWRLTVIFAGLTAITLLSLWISPQGSKASMMNVSMGSMAKDMHLSDISIYDLLNQMEDNQSSGTSEDSHHEEQTETKNMGIITTVIIFGLIPFIIGGSIILAIVWIK